MKLRAQEASMFGRLLPRETSFFDFFEQHAALTVEGVKEFQNMVAEGGNISSKARRILEIEHETDVITHRCIEALHKTFITPLDRDDIHQLITRMDDIMDCVEAAADRISLYEVKEIMPEARDFAAVLLTAAERVQEAVGGLRHKKQAAQVIKICLEINRLENEADLLFRHTLARLFKEETSAVELIKWKEIFENLEDAADVCEDVANIIEGAILEAS
jgi:uncharacterized protein